MNTQTKLAETLGYYGILTCQSDIDPMQIECGVVDMHAALAARWALNVEFYAFLLICQKKNIPT